MEYVIDASRKLLLLNQSYYVIIVIDLLYGC